MGTTTPLMSVALRYFCASIMAVAGLTTTAVPRAASGVMTAWPAARAGFFGYELGLLFGVEFSAAVYDEAEGEE